MNDNVWRAVRALMGAALGLTSVRPVLAADTSSTDHPPHEQVVIEGQRAQDYKVDTSGISKLTEPLLDTPQTINTVSEQVMQDRAIVTLNDALKNVPGITIGAGEFKSIGTSPTIRGFVARDVPRRPQGLR
jgi:catecholate siderophore receptor